MRRVLLFGVLLIVIPLIIWSFGGRQKKETAGVVEPASPATSLLVAKSDAGEGGPASPSQGGITVATQPVAVSGENVVFEFAIDTHSGDLTSFPVLEKVSLVLGEKEVLPKEWQETSLSGHHRSGKLVFRPGVRQSSTLSSDPNGPAERELELVIRDLGGIPERRFKWML